MQLKNLTVEHGKALPIRIYDSFVLFTNISYNKLKSAVRDLISFCLKGCEKQFIALKNLVPHVYFDNLSFRQIAGVLMSPDLEDTIRY